MNVVRISAWNVFGDRFLLIINLLRSNKAGSPSAISLPDYGVSVKWAAIDINHSRLAANVNWICGATCGFIVLHQR